MKKKTISMLIILLISITMNAKHINATIEINGKQWDENNKCVYKNKYQTITLYYKGGETILTDTFMGRTENGNMRYISSSDSTVKYTENKVKYEITNEVLAYEKCPEFIYRYSGSIMFGPMKYIYSSKKKNAWDAFWDMKSTTAYILDAKISEIPDIDNTDTEDCQGIINTTTKKIINKYLGYIHIIVPIMILALGVFDFFKAMIASKEDEMKKAQKRFIIRLVAGVLVFLAPTIVNLIITMLNTGACTID